MIKKISVKPLENFRLELAFNDGEDEYLTQSHIYALGFLKN